MVAVVIMVIPFCLFSLDFSEEEIKRECGQWQDWAGEIRVDLFSPSVEMVRECRKVGVELPIKK